MSRLANARPSLSSPIWRAPCEEAHSCFIFFSRIPVPPVPAHVRPDRAQPDARKSHRQLPVQEPQGVVREERGPPVPGRLRAAQAELPVAKNGPRHGRSLYRVRRYREQDYTIHRTGKFLIYLQFTVRN